MAASRPENRFLAQWSHAGAGKLLHKLPNAGCLRSLSASHGALRCVKCMTSSPYRVPSSPPSFFLDVNRQEVSQCPTDTPSKSANERRSVVGTPSAPLIQINSSGSSGGAWLTPTWSNLETSSHHFEVVAYIFFLSADNRNVNHCVFCAGQLLIWTRLRIIRRGVAIQPEDRKKK